LTPTALGGIGVVPTYEYRCNNCRKRFTVTMGIKEHDQKVVKCPKCKSRKVSQQLSRFFANTAKKS
jgi:putative FmdB family regulatory protein